MAREGWIKLWRKADNNPALDSASRIGVWAWLLMRAAHEPTTTRVAGVPVRVGRGQVALSIRKTSEHLKISEKSLRFTLDVFVKHGLIERGASKGAGRGTSRGAGRGTSFTLLTICNYDRYQASRDPQGRELGHSQGRSQGRELGHTEEEESKKVRKKESDSSLPGSRSASRKRSASLSNGSDRFHEFWACWDIPGTKREPRKAEARYRSLISKGEATHEELCDGVRRYMAECREADREIRYIKHPTTWLNAGCWRDEEPTLHDLVLERRRRQHGYG